MLQPQQYSKKISIKPFVPPLNSPPVHSASEENNNNPDSELEYHDSEDQREFDDESQRKSNDDGSTEESSDSDSTYESEEEIDSETVILGGLTREGLAQGRFSGGMVQMSAELHGIPHPFISPINEGLRRHLEELEEEAEAAGKTPGLDFLNPAYQDLFPSPPPPVPVVPPPPLPSFDAPHPQFPSIFQPDPMSELLNPPALDFLHPAYSNQTPDADLAPAPHTFLYYNTSGYGSQLSAAHTHDPGLSNVAEPSIVTQGLNTLKRERSEQARTNVVRRESSSISVTTPTTMSPVPKKQKIEIIEISD